MEKEWSNFFKYNVWSSKKVGVIFLFFLGRFYFVSNVTNSFIHSSKLKKKKKCLRTAGFIQLSALYANVRHDPRSEYNYAKVSAAGVNGGEASGAVQRGF